MKKYEVTYVEDVMQDGKWYLHTVRVVVEARDETKAYWQISRQYKSVTNVREVK